MEKQALLNRLIDEGLVLYGVGKFHEAVGKWREALKIDPENNTIKDYIISAGFSLEERDDTISVGFAERLIEEDKKEEALEILNEILSDDSENEKARELLSSIKESLTVEFRDRFSNRDIKPVLMVDYTELTNYSLNREEGFIISLIDGQISIQDIMDSSGMSEFEVMRILLKLRKLGVIGMG